MEQIVFDKINYKAFFKGFKKSKDGYHTAIWLVKINSEEFDYFEGLWYFFINNPNRTLTAFFINNLIKVKDESYDFRIGTQITDFDINKYFNKDRLYISDKKLFIKKPDLKDVLYSIISNSQALNLDFEDWCDEYGYNPDSKKHTKIYEKCIENTVKIIHKANIGYSLQELQEYFQDY
jgi:hypothetical protein